MEFEKKIVRSITNIKNEKSNETKLSKYIWSFKNKNLSYKFKREINCKVKEAKNK